MSDGADQRVLGACAELSGLADQIGEFIQYWGFKKVHGRIWAHLFLSKVPFDAMDIRRRLNISKALVSLSVRDLIHYGVIREAGKSERGTILYEANPDIREAIFNVLRTREKKMMARIDSALKLVDALGHETRCQHHLAEERLKGLGDLIGRCSSSLELLLDSQAFDGDALDAFFGIQKACQEMAAKGSRFTQ